MTRSDLRRIGEKAGPDPEWHNARKVHDWRNYVSEEIRELWPFLTEEERGLVFLCADKAASQEEWD